MQRHRQPSSWPGAVTDQLRTYLHERHRDCAYIGTEYAELTAALEEFVLRGEAVAPGLRLLGWRAVVWRRPTRLPAPAYCASSMALELLQACALIHDDVIDDSDTRRGLPTVHRLFTERHRERGWRGSSAQFGLSAAILAGDLALAWADDIVTDRQT